MRVLIVEDEHRIAQSIKKGLEQERYAVDVSYSGDEGYDLAVTEDYDVIILDRMIPGIDGLTFIKNIREKKIHTPILMLTARSLTEDKVLGLNTGADDYLTKPFSFEELLARIRAISRRPKQTLSSLLQFGEIRLDTQTYQVFKGDKEISLSQKEFALLEYLLRQDGQIVTKEQIIAHVWNYDADVLPNTVEVNIKNLRKKLDTGEQSQIQTIRGFGYKLRKD